MNQPPARKLAAPQVYPASQAQDIVDNYHGKQVADPYRWLEEPATPESRAWTDEQNQLTRSLLDGEPRELILARLRQLCAYTRWSAPFKQGGRYFFWQNEGLQNQPVLYWQRNWDEEPALLLNPNTIHHEGIVAAMNVEPSRNGEWLAYSLSQRGSDWQEVRIRQIDSGEDLPETLQHTKFAGIAWHPDHSGFYYNRYPDPGTVTEADLNYYNSVYWHTLNTDQSEDRLVYERPDQKDFDFWPSVSEDGAYLLLMVFLGTDRRNRFYYRPLEQGPASAGDFVRLLDLADAHYRFLGNHGRHFYFFTDHEAPRGKVIAIDLDRPEPEHWQTIIPEGEEVLTHAVLAAGHFVAVYLHHAHHRILLYSLDGGAKGEIRLPTLGSVDEIHGRDDAHELFFGFSSFLFPARSYCYDFATGELRPIFASRLDFEADDYVTRQAFCTSADGTRVPMFLVHRADLVPDPANPVLMYGYGGFRHAMTPSFTASLLPWLEQGGVYCLVNTRGGSEYGTEWYQAGTLERKQNVFDDFLAAGAYLVEQGLTSPARLAIRGGSNGGLLVAACMLQRPQLFGAVVCQVPVLDMLRYHRFTIGRYWVSDYGNAEEDPEHFAFLMRYSPLHNVKPEVDYPPILITSADHDDRVVPAHAKKFAATLQTNAANLSLLRVDTDAGHGRGKPLAKVMEEMADIYAFLAQALGMVWR
ncbi:MAG TPA: prolyl oligopeptidase family serine peptidase [Candidatus Obscuribacterales bacterium]